MQKTAYEHRSVCRRRLWPCKNLMVMKPALILLTALMLAAGATGLAQNVSYSGKNVTLEKVFSHLEKQTGYFFLYTKETLAGAKRVTISVKDMPLRDFLDKVFKDQPLTYTISSKTILIFPAPPPGEMDRPVIAPQEALTPPLTIAGIVADASGIPVAGATIVLKGTGRGISAGNDGGFILHTVPPDAVIEVSAIGFAPQTLKLFNNAVIVVNEKGQVTGTLSWGNLENIIVKLTRSTSPLDETVIVAYGTTTRRLNTGNVSTVKGEEIARQPVMTVQQALQGRVPGLDITFNSGHSAAPVKMEIRGRNSLNPNVFSDPLYIVDGVPVSVLNVANPQLSIMGQNSSTGMVQGGLPNTYGENILSFINPKDIESIDVLKDADATAIYGSRGSNGVILITTKKAKPGPTRFNISLSQAIRTIPKKLPLLNTQEYLAMRREAFRNDGTIITPYNAMDLVMWDTTRYTDWQNELYGTGKETQIQAGVSGGMLQTTYNINASFRSVQDLMNNEGKNEAATINMSLNHQSANQKFTLGLSSLLSLTNVEATIMGGSIYLPPNAPPVYNKKGDLNFEEWKIGSLSILTYPFASIKRPSESKTHSIQNSLNISYEVVKGFTASATAGYGFASNSNARYEPLTSFDPATNPMAYANFGSTTNTNWIVEPQLKYSNYLGKGSLNVLIGGSLQTVNTKAITYVGIGFPSDNLIRSINNAMTHYIGENYAEYKYSAVFGRINYNWDSRYIVNLNIRRDGSSRFGPGKQFGNFGSVGIAWIASRENWLRKILPAWISFAKLRASYGSSGSDNIGDYQYLSRWSTNADAFGTRLSPYGNTTSLLIMQPVNQQYQWESTMQFETGLELSFLQDRVNLTASYYRKRSGNQLTQVPTPAYTGFETVAANWNAFVQNSGVEITAYAKLLNRKDFFIAASFNIGINRNKLLKYPNIDKSPYATRYKVGESLSAGYYLHYTGVDPMTGTQTFEDRNKDGTITAFSSFIPGDPNADRYMVIDATPRYSGGFGLQTAYKQFDLHLFFTYKKQLGNNPFTTLVAGSMTNVVLPEEIKNNHWQHPGDHALYPKYTINNLSPINYSDGAFTDASYVKLNNVTLSYELSQRLVQKARLQSVKFSVSVQNLFYITSFKGVSPELQRFTDVSPISRTIAAGLNFNF